MENKWVVTGYSGKQDGLLFVVEATTEIDAYKKVSELTGEYLYNLGEEGEPKYVLSYIKPDEYMLGLLSYEEPRYEWALHASKLKLDTCLNEAVSW